jgi:asparagine synthase (glutamine-hydrolysing)
MCGVYGILDLNQRRPDVGQLARMARVTTHRGPDDEGSYADGPLLMGMRRLSIIDLGSGHQPISNEDATVWVICNGEIYNFRELRAQLQSQGHRFQTGSDTEVIVHLYEEHGDDLVHRLDGMFGFALWDARRRRLLIARDRLGIKPMYLKREPGRVLFASELKAILNTLDSTPAFDRVALREYLSLGYVPSPLSIFEGIEKLDAGTLFRVDLCTGKSETVRFWQPSSMNVDERRTGADWSAMVRAQVEKSVAAQMVSDVPLGAFLSGGIDSSSVVAMMAKHSSQPVKTYSIGFEAEGAGELYNELQYARRVADLFATDHKEIIVRPDVASLLPKLLWHMDEPVADSAFITTYLVSELARQDVKVILSGVGGDELFGGYRRYLGGYYDRWMALIPRTITERVLIPIAKRLPSDRHSAALNVLRLAKSFVLSQGLDRETRYRHYVGVFTDERLDRLLVDSHRFGVAALTRAFDQVASSNPLAALMEVDLATQLPDDLLLLTDRMTMASSIECRVPLIDQALVELALAMPPSFKIKGRDLKHVLKAAMKDVLPHDILYRSKRGFGAPMGAWLKQSLSGMTDALLSKEVVEKRGLFRYDVVASLIADHRANVDDHTDHLQALTNLEIFSRVFVDGRSTEDVAVELKELSAA